MARRGDADTLAQVGGVLGLLLILGGLAWYFWRKRKRAKAAKQTWDTEKCV